MFHGDDSDMQILNFISQWTLMIPLLASQHITLNDASVLFFPELFIKTLEYLLTLLLHFVVSLNNW